MPDQTIDYDALAKQAGAVPAQPSGGAVDYDALAKQAGATSSTPAQPPEPRTVGGFISNVGTSGAQFLGNIGSAVVHPKDTLEGLVSLGEGMAEKTGFPAVNNVPHAQNVDALINLYKDRYGSWEGLKHTLYTDPMGAAADLATLASGAGGIAKGVQLAADAGKLGTVADVAGTVARGAKTVSDFTDPLSLTGKAVGAAVRKTGLPEYLYRTALRPGYNVTTPIEDVQAMTKTGLEQGIPISQKGGEKIQSAIDDLNKAISDRVNNATAAGVTVNRGDVAQRLDPVVQRFAKQVAPNADLRDIQKVFNEWMTNNPSNVTAADAQAMKVGTYQQLKSKYGKLSDAETEAQKALAMGIKEELVSAMPELQNLNEKESKLLDLQGAVEKAVNKSYNQVGGIPSWMKGEAAGAAAGHPGAGAVLGVMKGVLSDPNLRSRLAIAIKQGQWNNPAVRGSQMLATGLSRVKAYEDSLQAPAAEQAVPGYTPAPITIAPQQ